MYLHPDREADAQAMNVIESVPRSGRGELFRNAFIAGLALQQLDSRLPVLLATLLTQELTADQLVGLVSQTTGWKPSQADIRTILTELGAGQLQSLPEVEKFKDELDLDAARNKLKGFL
ncbi:plasmid partitioning/stability family protein [Obesumbacterium proteus]|uniref:plasmid partitioning/stability family protein n=1 Tax=Obesumbacterium proteus TaxID=82983 RepID=UPI003C6E27D2